MIDLCPAALVTEAMTRMHQCRASCVLVVEQQQLVGIFSERDVVKITAAQIETRGCGDRSGDDPSFDHLQCFSRARYLLSPLRQYSTNFPNPSRSGYLQWEQF
jgi:hypothetical protein